MIDRLKDRFFGGIIERDTTHLLLGQLQDLLDMPCDGLSLAVRVACQPYLIGLERLFAQRVNQLLLLLVDHIIRSIAIVEINAHAIFANTLDITNVPLR